MCTSRPGGIQTLAERQKAAEERAAYRTYTEEQLGPANERYLNSSRGEKGQITMRPAVESFDSWVKGYREQQADAEYLRKLRMDAGKPKAPTAPPAPAPTPIVPPAPQVTPGAPGGSAPSAPGVAPITPSDKYSREPDAIPPTGTGPGLSIGAKPGKGGGSNPLSIGSKKYRTLTGLGSGSFNVSGTPTGIRL